MTRRRRQLPSPAPRDPDERLVAELRSMEAVIAVLVRHASRCAQLEVLQVIDHQTEDTP